MTGESGGGSASLVDVGAMAATDFDRRKRRKDLLAGFGTLDLIANDEEEALIFSILLMSSSASSAVGLSSGSSLQQRRTKSQNPPGIDRSNSLLSSGRLPSTMESQTCNNVIF